jgi:hypothetical protein
MGIETYERVPKIVEAIQVRLDTFADIVNWLQSNNENCIYHATPHNGIYIELLKLKGSLKAKENDYIVKNDSGEFYVCDEHTFKDTFTIIGGNNDY